MEIESQIQEFVATEVAADEAAVVGRDDDLLDSGLLDSTAITMLVSFIEDRFDVEVEDEELVPENFRSIAAVSAFVASKAGAAQPE
ncbi:MAG TPA: phosphopantetheine-binding protein [Gaiellaceae bacterium]|jgi:acyl carrier protein